MEEKEKFKYNIGEFVEYRGGYFNNGKITDRKVHLYQIWGEIQPPIIYYRIEKEGSKTWWAKEEDILENQTLQEFIDSIHAREELFKMSSEMKRFEEAVLDRISNIQRELMEFKKILKSGKKNTKKEKKENE